ncbi:MAG: hypothetical protein ABL949_08100 [Fimbriimonadaceae bacterium]
MKFRSLFAIAVVGLFFVGALTPVTAEAQKKRTSKKSSSKRKKKPVVKKTVVVAKKVDASVTPIVGTWFTIDAEGKFAKANKFVFTKYGEFSYIGPGFKSSGKVTFAASVMNLTWLSIDGQPVKAGTIKKAIPVLPEKTFKIDRFTYKWAL